MSRTFLVTGGCGFIGSAITRALLGQGERVVVLDNLSTGLRDNLPRGEQNVQLIEGDILDEGLLASSMVGVDTVFHQAAVSSVPRSVLDPLLTHEVNATGTIRALNAARRAGVRRFVYAASASAYGNAAALPKVEDMAPEPLSPYAASKLAGEHYCRAFAAIYGMQTVALRYFNVFGAGQDPASEYAAVIPRFITAALERRPVVVFGDGEQTRDFCHIDDVVAANLLAIDAAQASGRMFNIACGSSVSLNQMLDVLTEIVGHEIARRHENSREGDVRHSRADIRAAEQLLGYRPNVSFRDGLRRTVNGYRR
jgi:nucleoside-diphosphate-sugar epimerase